MPVGLVRIESEQSDPRDIIHYRNGMSRVQQLGFRLAGGNQTLRKVIRDARPLLIHAHFASDGVQIMRLARRAKIPLVVTVHGIDVTTWPNATRFSGILGSLLLAGKRHLIRRMLSEAAAVIAVSEPLASRVRALGAPADRVHVLHLGAHFSEQTISAKRERGGILFVGRLVEKKGVGDLLRAVARLPEDLRSTHVSVVGDGPLRDELEHLARELAVNVTFHGSLTTAEVSRHMSAAAIFCSPSRTASNGDTEGLPISILEAGYHQLPTVSTIHSGIPEAIESGVTGFLAPEGDIESISAALANLLRDPQLREEMGSAALRKMIAEFDIEQCTARLELLYDLIVEAESLRYGRAEG
jgi:glycosyltransferase involved in cell wall biosynthesis